MIKPKLLVRGVEDLREGINTLKNSTMEGIPSSYKGFGNSITYKPGYHCIIAAHPTSGKSEWVLSEVANLAERDGAKTLIFSPEMGSAEEIVAILVQKLTGKTLYLGEYQIEDTLLERVLHYIDRHFFILDSEDRAFDMNEIYAQYDLLVEHLSKDLPKGQKATVEYIIIDNLNDIEEPLVDGRQDLGIEQMLTSVRRYNKPRNCFTFMVTHSSSQGKPIEKSGVRFYPRITQEEIRGGRAIYRKAYLLLTLWRPPPGLEEDGVVFLENEVRVIVLKGKPHGTAERGFEGRLFYTFANRGFTDIVPLTKVYV